MLIYLIDLWKHCDFIQQCCKSIKFSHHGYRDQNKRGECFHGIMCFFSIIYIGQIYLITLKIQVEKPLIIYNIIMCRKWFLISLLLTLKVQWQP